MVWIKRNSNTGTHMNIQTIDISNRSDQSNHLTRELAGTAGKLDIGQYHDKLIPAQTSKSIAFASTVLKALSDTQ